MNQEYIEIINTGCSPIDLVGISLRDAANKIFTFTGGTLVSGGIRRVLRPESKIILNNTDEKLDILDSHG